MSEIADAIASFEASALDRRPDLLARAREPITDQPGFFSVPLYLPDSIAAVSQWHDGGFILPGVGEWFPLERGPEHRARLREVARELSDGWPGPMMPIPRQWFPIATSDGHLTYVVELTESPRADSPVWLYDAASGPSLSAVWSSVERLFRVAVERVRTDDDATLTTLDLQIDAEFCQHETVEGYPDGWPRRWDTTL